MLAASRAPGGSAISVAHESSGGLEAGPCSIVLPVLDDAAGLVATLRELRTLADGGRLSFELVVVDDGSRDDTAAVLAQQADVRAIHHQHNRGYGAALKTGIAAAAHRLVVVMDADGTYPVQTIPLLVERCRTADMVVGARLGARVQSNPARNSVKWAFRQFAQWITARRIPDLNSGLRVFRRELAERYLDLLPDGFSFTTTITVASMLDGHAVAFETVDYLPRIGRSKVRPARDTYRIARQLLRLGVRLAPLRTAIAAALAVALLGVLFSAARLIESGGLGGGDLLWPLIAGVILVIGAHAQRSVDRRRG